MSGLHTLQLSARLGELEKRIKNTKLVKLEQIPSEQSLATRKLIEYARPMKTLDEIVSPEPTKNKHIGSNFDDFLCEEGLSEPNEPKSEQFKASFQEVLRLAKSGQQAWWPEQLKSSTDAHIDTIQLHYETHIK